MNPLARYSTEQLRAELNRRRREESPKKRNWCDECVNFVKWEGEGECPKDYQACGKNHTMSFAMPNEGATSTEWGFYRTGCKDWKRAAAH